ncbi:MAG: hypothetical protein IKW08_04185 [Roseburia sp.]|nr:hypothetical protein [Roseburia sp.]
MQSIETLLVMNLLVMIILGILVSFKLVASFLMEYLGFKLALELAKMGNKPEEIEMTEK